MKRLFAACLAALAVALWLTRAAQAVAWIAPIGIPNPTFCVDETAPAAPGSWPGAATAGYYYIDRTDVAATDTANANGYPAKPRVTVPTTLAAGSYVEIHGSGYTTTGSLTWTMGGTNVSKVWIVGMGNPDFTSSGSNQELGLRGDYWVLKGIKLVNLKIRTGNGVTGAGATFGCVREVEDTGFTYTGNSNIVAAYASAAALGHDLVFYANNIHDNGPLDAAPGVDLDQHGIGGFPYHYNVWIVDNTIARNTGDGIQINSSNGACCVSDATNTQLAHHVYIGRNILNANYQNGFWTKDARDVIFSQNESYGNACGVAAHTPCNFGPGVCGGMQYGPERVWFLYNYCHDNYGGIRIASDSNLHGTQVYVIGNLIINNDSGAHAVSPDGFSYSCIAFWDVDERYVIHNTCWANEGGIHATTSASTVTHIVDNILGGNTDTNDSNVLLQATPTSLVFSNNVVSDNRLSMNHAVETLAAYQARVAGSCAACTISIPTFVAPYTDFRLAAGDAVAKDTGTTNGVYATYSGLYGVSIAVDYLTVARPQNTLWDIGAYEYNAGGGGGGGGGATAAATKAKGKMRLRGK